MLAQPPIWLILVAFVCALGPLVFFHELGHYLVARWFGVGAEVFSIGFGREVTGWTDRRGTRWKVGWLPLGGYVRFVGDENAVSAAGDQSELTEEQKAKSFHLRPVYQRFLIVLAGPLANFILAILIFVAFFSIFGAPRSNIVGEVEPGSPAAVVGLAPGDRILAVDGIKTPTFSDLMNVVSLRPNASVSIDVEREGTVRRQSVKLTTDVMKNSFGQETERGLLGVRPMPNVLEPLPLWQAVPEAISFTFRLTRSIIDGLWQIITGRISVNQIGGPIKIAQVAGEGASLGALPFISIVALLSINLGFINLLPVPMLDGGHLLFYSIEGIRRRPVSVRAQEWAFRGGLAFVLALLVFTTVNDLGSFGLWERLGRLIG